MKDKKVKKTSIGGQAVLEGVMMRGPKETAIAVRKPDGEIIVEKKPINSFVQKFKINKIPIVRGVFSFFESLIVGTKALMFSAEVYDVEDEDDKKKKESLYYLYLSNSLFLILRLFDDIRPIFSCFFKFSE